jgi:hypothetical protein
LRSTNSSGPFTLLAVAVTANSYTDFSVTNKARYYYLVQAVNPCGPSTNSNPVSGTLAALNVTPVLAPIPDHSLLAGQTLRMTNAATDADLPAEILTYSLLAAPSGVSINPVSGLLTWRPTIAQSGTTNLLTVAVFDNGIPSLWAKQNFTVTVLTPAHPTFSAPTFTNGVFQSWVSGSTGPDYTVLGSTNLVDWGTILTTNSPATPFLFSAWPKTPSFGRRLDIVIRYTYVI